MFSGTHGRTQWKVDASCCAVHWHLHDNGQGTGERKDCAQVTMAELLQHWGEEGFEAHVRTMQREYAGRAAALQAAAQARDPP